MARATSARTEGAAPRRVVVTGLGCVTPLGTDVESTWEAACEGRSGAAPFTLCDASELPVTFGAEVKGDFEIGEIPAKERRRMDRCVEFALAAAHQALGEAALPDGAHDPTRIGVAIGSGIGGLGTLISNHDALQKGGARRVSPFTIPMSIGNMPSGYVALTHGLQGPNLAHVSACATGAHAIGESTEMIRRGDADVMLAGGVEAPIVPIGIAGFAAMRALSTRNDEPSRASRPFDRGRDGFVLGEGGGVLVLEEREAARARGAAVLGEVVGYGATADASHMAAPLEDGSGAARCMRLALESAGLEPEAVGYVNAHATSTPAGDVPEVLALRSVFGDALEGLPVSATKSMTGHLLGAAGAVEAILCLRALATGLLPPTINLDDPDPECALDHVRNKARSVPARVALSNSFGFGGTNATLILTAGPTAG